MVEKNLVNLNARIPFSLKEVLKKYFVVDFHTNVSEFSREDLREKIKRDAQQLYRNMLTEGLVFDGRD